jgi:ELWxxDGT repeat protein
MAPIMQDWRTSARMLRVLGSLLALLAVAPAAHAQPAVLVKDINPLPGVSSDLYGFGRLGTSLVFSANDGVHGPALWRTDGTAEGTVLVKQAGWSGSLDPPDVAEVEGTLFFAADGELWKTDGTSSGTALVKQVNPGGPSRVSGLRAGNGLAFFVADDGAHGLELWRSDGTPSGTFMLEDAPSTGGYYTPTPPFAVIGKLAFFGGAGESFTHRLWKTDGTVAGTMPVGSEATVGSGVAFRGELYFDGGLSPHGVELWKSDGTAQGTVLVKDICPGSGGSFPASLTVVGDTLFFTASDTIHGEELWKSDGTEAGTTLVKDIRPGIGAGLWFVSSELTRVSDQLFFVADDGAHASEIWVSDGTEVGTHLVRDIVPGSEDGFGRPGNLIAVDERLVFTTPDETHGYELWTSDGTEAGTTLVQDIRAGPVGSEPGPFARLGRRLIFRAETEATGAELWSLALPPPRAADFYTVEPCRLLDTRDRGGSALSGGSTRTAEAIGHCGVPVTARAIMVNVTATEPSVAGHLRLFEARDARPDASSINFAAGQTRANSLAITLDEAGRFAVYSGQPEGRVHVIVDVTGYFQ